MESRIARQNEQASISYTVIEYSGRSLSKLGKKSFDVIARINGNVPRAASLTSAANPESAWSRRGAMKAAEKRMGRIIQGDARPYRGSINYQ